jgi:zinc ribbon protein/SH3 domain-containing protein
MFCTQCGQQVDQGKNFCGNCGAKVGKAPEPISPAPVEEVRPPLASTASQTGSRVRSEQLSAPQAQPIPISPTREGRGINNTLIIGATLGLIVAAGAGIYFGTDLFRQPAKQQPVPAEQAKIAPRAPAGTVEEPKVPGETSDSNLASTGQPSLPESAPQAAVEASKSMPASSSSRRTASAGIYEILRTTTVFAEPSGSSRTVATIPQGTRVTVVGANGEWLEVTSKSGKPPGFIRGADATFAEKSN